MPHSIHHEFYEPSVPENAPSIQESSSGSNWLNRIRKGKGHRSSHTFIALNPQDPYELGGTPVEEHQNAKSAQQEISEPYQMISEATVGLIAALQKFNCQLDLPPDRYLAGRAGRSIGNSSSAGSRKVSTYHKTRPSLLRRVPSATQR